MGRGILARGMRFCFQVLVHSNGGAERGRIKSGPGFSDGTEFHLGLLPEGVDHPPEIRREQVPTGPSPPGDFDKLRQERSHHLGYVDSAIRIAPPHDEE